MPSHGDFPQFDFSKLDRHGGVGEALAGKIVRARDHSTSRPESTKIADMKFPSTDDGRERSDMDVVSDSGLAPAIEDDEVIDKDIVPENGVFPVDNHNRRKNSRVISYLGKIETLISPIVVHGSLLSRRSSCVCFSRADFVPSKHPLRGAGITRILRFPLS